MIQMFKMKKERSSSVFKKYLGIFPNIFWILNDNCDWLSSDKEGIYYVQLILCIIPTTLTKFFHSTWIIHAHKSQEHCNIFMYAQYF